MNNDFFLREMTNDLISYDINILSNIYNKLINLSKGNIELNRYTFKIEDNYVFISDDVYFDEIGEFKINKKQFLELLKRLIDRASQSHPTLQ